MNEICDVIFRRCTVAWRGLTVNSTAEGSIPIWRLNYFHLYSHISLATRQSALLCPTRSVSKIVGTKLKKIEPTLISSVACNGNDFCR